MQVQEVFSNKKNQSRKRMRNALTYTGAEKLGGEHRTCKCALVNEQMKEKQVSALRGGGTLGTR